MEETDRLTGAPSVSPLAGTPAERSQLVDVPALLRAYYSAHPDPGIASQRVAFGTSGHRGSSLACTFNEPHVLAITQAICEYRHLNKTEGPLFLGKDTHALSEVAATTAVEVLAANRVDVMLSEGTLYTPTPVISHAILTHNRTIRAPRADGIVVTPSHNPPEDGGFKYNPPTGGPASTDVTTWIERRANELLEERLQGVRRITSGQALTSATTHQHDYLGRYVDDLAGVIDFEAIRSAGVRIGVDPLGGAGIDYWPRIAERYGLSLSVVDAVIDPTFRFMSLDWDGRIRMDPSSPYAMQRLVGLKDRFDIAVGCDPDHDRYGIVTPGAGLLPPNHHLAVCIQYLFTHRTEWGPRPGVGKTVVTSAMIDRVTAAMGRRLFEVPVGFKWFVQGLLDGALGVAGEESAGASLLRRDGTVWTTDKDGLVIGLLAAEITSRAGRDPGEIYDDLTRQYGACYYARTDLPVTRPQAAILGNLSREQLRVSALAGQPVQDVLTAAPGNSQPIGGVRVVTEDGWFAVRPSGTEPIYKLYAESFRDPAHLRAIQRDAQEIISRALDGTPPQA